MIDYKSEIKKLKNKLSVTVVAHFYQIDDVYNLADITGDSLELAQKCKDDKSDFIIFCGVEFMGQSVKVISPNKRVLMPKIADCSMAKMVNSTIFDKNIKLMESYGISKDNILAITYINSDVEIKAKVGEMDGFVCTSSNAYKIIEAGLKTNKKIFFLPDSCLGINIANKMGLKSTILKEGMNRHYLDNIDIICFDGFCSVHQLFTTDNINFFREKYKDIKIVTHPECSPAVVNKSDFTGSTSEIIKYIKNLDKNQKIAVGTEFNLVNRLRDKNTYILSSTKASCPTMNETTLEDLYNILKSIEDKKPINEIFVDEKLIKNAQISLNKMLNL